jgi:hypothetical protein
MPSRELGRFAASRMWPGRPSDVDGDLGAEKDEGPEQDREERRKDAAEGLEVGQILMVRGHDHANHHPHYEAE